MKYAKVNRTHMPTPQDVRKKPATVKVNVSDGSGLDVGWADGHSSHYNFDYLREQCPCALCDEKRKNGEVPGGSAGSSADNPLHLFKPRPGARGAKSVGSYALQIDFTDGHDAGIYSFDYLRTICPCAECAKLFRSDPETAATS
jgi:DUF971 family protein